MTAQNVAAPHRVHPIEKYRPYALPALVVAGIVALVTWASGNPLQPAPSYQAPGDLDPIVEELDRHLERRWADAVNDRGESRPLIPAKPAEELQVLRRLSLALVGTVPSLEEIRQFEADDQPHKLRRWTLRYLDDSRFATYFAERLARAYVSTEGGTFIIYRRDRFVNWLAGQLRRNVPYDAIVREMIASDGLWTGAPQTNFMTAGYNDGKFDVNKLAGRSVRAFLGQRIDCAQCHDHKLDDRWKQHHFEGLAAFYAQSRLTPFGIADKAVDKDGNPIEYDIEDPAEKDKKRKRTVAPAVPFLPELLPAEGNRREQLAAWITHRKNRRFERAAANRIWALLFGRAYTHPSYAVDDLPDPDDEFEATDTKLLDILGRDFREHDYDLRRMILAITATRAFRMSYQHPVDRPANSEEELRSINREIERHENNWAVFPFSRLRPEQVIGSMIQSASARTIDQNSHLVVRFFRAVRENDFVKEYGDPGGDELVETAGTIPQALLRMNGNLPNEMLKATGFSLSGRIASQSDTDRQRVEVCFLVGFCRRPTEEEMERCLDRYASAGSKAARDRVTEDLYWVIFNSPEFSWNH